MSFEKILLRPTISINSTYHNILITLLTTLTSNTNINYGFYIFSYGENRDKVYAIGLWRGDVLSHECHNCLSGSKSNLTHICPNKKEAIIWSEDEKCMLILGVMEDVHVWLNLFDKFRVVVKIKLVEELLGLVVTSNLKHLFSFMHLENRLRYRHCHSHRHCRQPPLPVVTLLHKVQYFVIFS